MAKGARGKKQDEEARLAEAATKPLWPVGAAGATSSAAASGATGGLVLRVPLGLRVIWCCGCPRCCASGASVGAASAAARLQRQRLRRQRLQRQRQRSASGGRASVSSQSGATPGGSAGACVIGPVRGRGSWSPMRNRQPMREGLVWWWGGTGGSPPAASPVETRGTRQTGAPCTADSQCAEGLSCVENSCAAGSTGGGGLWGGW